MEMAEVWFAKYPEMHPITVNFEYNAIVIIWPLNCYGQNGLQI